MAGGGEAEAAKQSIFVSISKKIGEAYAWLRDELISLLKLFRESITEAFLRLKSFVTCCCEKLREVLSAINTQLHNFSKKKMGVPEEEEEEEEEKDMKMKMKVSEKSSLLGEMKMLSQNLRNPMNEWLGSENNPEMKSAYLKLNGFLGLFEGFTALLEYANRKPLLLIPPIVNGFLMYRSYQMTGRVTIAATAAGHEGKADMAICTLISLISPSSVGFM